MRRERRLRLSRQSVCRTLLTHLADAIARTLNRNNPGAIVRAYAGDEGLAAADLESWFARNDDRGP